MVGIALSSVPSIPKKDPHKSELVQIEEQLYAYIENIHRTLKGQLQNCADNLLKEHPEASPEEGLELFLNASFKHDRIIQKPPMINETIVKKCMIRRHPR
jgi:hypothetical protein